MDQAPETPEHKLPLLCQYLFGDVLKVLERLEHFGYSYEAAKETFARKNAGLQKN